MVRSKMPNKNKQQSSSAKSRLSKIRRAELLLLEAQRSLLEQRITQLNQVGESNLLGVRNSKRQSSGLLDGSKGSKRTKYDVPVTLGEMFSECRKLLNQLRRNKDSAPFLSPVDPVALNCLDYFAIIKHPMDFTTIAGKLKTTNCRYHSPLDFRDDMRLVFKNCMLYNPEGNQIRNMGDRMSAAFETLWQNSNLERIFQDRQKLTSKRMKEEGFDSANQGGEMGPNGEKARVKRRRKEPTVESSLQRLTAVNSKMQELMSMALNEVQSIDAMEIDQPMSFWQRRQLSHELDNLSIEALTNLHPILQQLDEQEFVFDELEDPVLWNLKSILKDVQNHLKASGDEVVKAPVESEEPPENAEQNLNLQNCNVQPLNKVLDQAAENKIEENQIPVILDTEGPIQEICKDTHSSFGCCGHEIGKKTPRSNGKDDLME